MHDSYTASMKIINGQNVSDYQSRIVNNLITLIAIRSGITFVNGFTLNEINQMIEIIATDESRLSMYSVRGYNIHYNYYIFLCFHHFLINCVPCEYEINDICIY